MTAHVGRRTGGSLIEPSGCWYVSRIAISTRAGDRRVVEVVGCMKCTTEHKVHFMHPTRRPQPVDDSRDNAETFQHCQPTNNGCDDPRTRFPTRPPIRPAKATCAKACALGSGRLRVFGARRYRLRPGASVDDVARLCLRRSPRPPDMGIERLGRRGHRRDRWRSRRSGDDPVCLLDPLANRGQALTPSPQPAAAAVSFSSAESCRVQEMHRGLRGAFHATYMASEDLQDALNTFKEQDRWPSSLRACFSH